MKRPCIRIDSALLNGDRLIIPGDGPRVLFGPALLCWRAPRASRVRPLLRDCPGDRAQIMGKQAEADPAVHACVAVVAAAVQLVAAFEPADAAPQ